MIVFKTCTNCGMIHPFNKKRCEKGRYHKLGPVRKRDTAFNARSTSRFANLSRLFKEDCKNLCAICIKEGVVNSSRIEVHHIEKIKDRPDLAYDYDNLICLCSVHHHLAERGFYSKDYLRKIRPPVD